MGLFRRLKRSSASKVPKTTCIVPLYICPTSSATWQPLLEAMDNNPSMDFVVIVNPDSGPGTALWWPDPGYVAEVPKLNARSNCTTVGYVRVDYCNRDVSDVLADIRQYAKWPSETGAKGVHVSGIFFDETPHESSQFKVTYIQKITQEAITAEGILGENLIIHNPGTLPDTLLASERPDITAVFEGSYERLLQPDPEELKSLVNYDRADACYMVHSVPIDSIKTVTREIRKQAQYVFITDSRERHYEQFGASFKDYIDAMAADY